MKTNPTLHAIPTRLLRCAVLPFLALLCLVSCHRADEIDFSGKVIEARHCSLSYMEPSAAYLVQLDKPDSFGGTYIDSLGTHHNVVALYEAPCRIYCGDHIEGTFYLEENASRLYCSIHWTDLDLPSGVFTSVKVD